MKCELECLKDDLKGHSKRDRKRIIERPVLCVT